MKKLLSIAVLALMAVTLKATHPVNNGLDLSSLVEPITSDPLTPEDIITDPDFWFYYTDNIPDLHDADSIKWGVPTFLGRVNGKDIRLLFNRRTKLKTIFHDFKPLVSLAQIEVIDVDSARNRATLRRGVKNINLNFNDPATLTNLKKRLSRIPAGWSEYAYTYSFDESESDIRHSTQVVVTLPDNPAFSAEVLKYILSLNLHIDYDSEGESHDSGRPVKNARDYVARKAESFYLSGLKNGKTLFHPAKPNKHFSFYSSYNITHEIFPELLTDRFVTLNVYSIGSTPVGGSDAQFLSYTFDRKTGKQLEFDDVFKSAGRAKVNRIYFQAVADQLNDVDRKYADDPDEFEPQFTAQSVFECLQDFEDRENGRGMSTFKITTPLAISDDGIIFSYDLSLISDFGEDPLVTVLVPYAKLAGLLKIRP